MRIAIKVPTRNDILHRAQDTPVSRDGEPWSKECLGRFADMNGVYVHCSGKKVLYVGKTTRGNYGTFGERLSRELQKKASGNSSLYRLLCSQRKVTTAFIPLPEVEKRTIAKGLSKEDLAILFERALIAVFKPSGNSGPAA